MARKKKAQKSTAIVVYQDRAQARPSSKKSRQRANKSRKPVASNAVAHYRAALLNPFSDQAYGARVPDMFASPTVSLHYEQTFTLKTNANGEADVVILPNLYNIAVSPRSSLPQGSDWQTMDGQGITLASIVQPTSALSAKVSNYRIVAYGVRVYSTASYSAGSGRVLLATTPVSSWVNSKSATIGGQSTTNNNASASKQSTLVAYGVPTLNQQVDISTMPTMLSCMETSVTGLATTPVIVAPKVTSPEAFEFRQAGDSSIGFDINNQTSATYVSSGDASYLRVAGHEAVVIALTQAPTNSNVLSVEVIYHVEGAPAYSTFVSNSPAIAADPLGMAQAVAAAAKSPVFKQGVEMAGNVVYPGLGTFARSLMG